MHNIQYLSSGAPPLDQPSLLQIQHIGPPQCHRCWALKGQEWFHHGPEEKEQDCKWKYYTPSEEDVILMTTIWIVQAPPVPSEDSPEVWTPSHFGQAPQRSHQGGIQNRLQICRFEESFCSAPRWQD